MTTIDIRSKKTRQQIIEAFITLLHQKSLEKIKIADITNQAQINRVTFYNYFTDKYHLLDMITKETLLAQIQEQILPDEPFSLELLKKIFLILADFHTDMASICKKNYVEALSFYTSPVLRKDLQLILQRAIPKPLRTPESEILTTSTSWLLIGMAYEWKKSQKIPAALYFDSFKHQFEQYVLQTQMSA
ncbi:TetR/AcrR family transcriptional regulator [Enterococcus cecorum]|uniref:TetR/AcrR family transcriptional regulator n=1 Tax=Enterococcus cecorum TaxID=44008 RepID=UPI001FABCFD7|nr:TetR/AcrR family transcriptional regulator [Enterococcus cecorum]MCJ0592340.1 TetR/AcrR family transcriptional regulator [Enterococcus cecorum]